LKNKQTVTFLNCYDSFAEAQRLAKKTMGPTIILHMQYGNIELFAHCDEESLTMISEAFSDEVLKGKNG